jgi:hypothetical protein
MRIHHYHAVAGDDDRRIGIDLEARRRDGRIDAVGHRLQLEQVVLGGLRIGGEGAARIDVVEGLHRGHRHAGAGQELAASPG